MPLPVVSGQRSGSAVLRLTLAADAGDQPGLVLPGAGITPVPIDGIGVGALSRPTPRGPEFTARDTAPGRAVRPIRHRAGHVLRRGARWRGAGAALGAPVGACRRAGPVRPGAWIPQPAGGRWQCRLRQHRLAGTDLVAAGLTADGLRLCIEAGAGQAINHIWHRPQACVFATAA